MSTEKNRREFGGRSPCPICGKPSASQTRPFCSRRCADIDLSRWLGGHYRIASDERAEGHADLAEPDAVPADRAGIGPRHDDGRSG